MPLPPVTPLPPVDPERNRELLAGRLGWPDGALDACRHVETGHPGWHVWWSRNPWRRDGQAPPGPAYCAARKDARWNDRSLYAPTPEDLALLIAAEGR